MIYAIGIDMGGTNIKVIAITDSGKTLKKKLRATQDTPTASNPPAWAEDIKQLIGELKTELNHAPAYIGICAPGLVAKDERSIAIMPGRLTGLEGFDWPDFLQENAFVIDDAKAALLGEIWQGAAAGFQNVIMLTLGTGVGGAIFSDGRLLMGNVARAGNVGHISLDVDGACDVAGMPGSLENSIGECTVKHRSQNKFNSTKDLVEAAENGDELAKAVWQRSVYKLACGIASLINVVDPELILIGGGIAKAGPALFNPLRHHLDRLEWKPAGQSVKVAAAELGEWAGAIGAAYHAIQKSYAANRPF